MHAAEFIRAISVQDVDIAPFVQLAICDEASRKEIIHLMLTHPDIMVYYHCYYVVAKASQERPDLFLPYWCEFASLLNHPNSYHRDFGLTLIANLTPVDHEDLFSEIYSTYFEHVHDPRFMTGRCCVQNSLKILKHKPDLKNDILALLLQLDDQSTYSEKQKALLKCDVLEILDQLYEEIPNKRAANEFIQACVFSISPKTKRKALDLKEKCRL